MDTYKIINEFIEKMNYKNNPHVIGCVFHGSALKGNNDKYSDIDLYIIFDNDDPTNLIRGNMYVDNIRIEYFEKPINDIYKNVDISFYRQDNAMLRIIGKGQIIFDKTGDVKTLQDYTLRRYQKPLPPISEERAREQVSVINNRMKEITKAYENNSINFYNLYHLTIEKIRRFYHNLNGLAMIPTPKVYRIYTDEEYRKSFDGINIPEPEFIELYLNAMTDISLDKDIMYEKISDLWNYSKRNVKLNELNYRISIKTRNNNQI